MNGYAACLEKCPLQPYLKDRHEEHPILTAIPKHRNLLQGKTAVYLKKCNGSRFEPSANITVFSRDYIAISSLSFCFSVLTSLYDSLLYLPVDTRK